MQISSQLTRRREFSKVGMIVHKEECHRTTIIEEEVEDDVVMKDEGWLDL